MNVDPTEIKKFNEAATQWWDLNGEFKALHAINPLRLDYIRQCVGTLAGKRVLDLGCGGGILSEAMAAAGAVVTGIDLSAQVLDIAKQHALEQNRTIDYRELSAEQLADVEPASFDLITCMEMLEHVPDPAAIVRACSRLLTPSGDVIFSTINRNPKSFLFAIVGAEYILNLVPRGTHQYQNFIRPSELASWCRQATLTPKDTIGLHYQPFRKHYWLAKNIDVNYFIHAIKS